MAILSARFRGIYGSHPGHLLTMAAGFALIGYLVVTAGPATLWKPQDSWWKSMTLWLAAATVFHDLVLFPIYSLADRVLGAPNNRRPPSRVSTRNHLRVPALGSGLILLSLSPDIIMQGAEKYFEGTGLTQEHFLGRWLMLTALMFGASALIYGTRLLLARQSHSGTVKVGCVDGSSELGSQRRQALVNAGCLPGRLAVGERFQSSPGRPRKPADPWGAQDFTDPPRTRPLDWMDRTG